MLFRSASVPTLPPITETVPIQLMELDRPLMDASSSLTSSADDASSTSGKQVVPLPAPIVQDSSVVRPSSSKPVTRTEMDRFAGAFSNLEHLIKLAIGAAPSQQ